MAVRELLVLLLMTAVMLQGCCIQLTVPKGYRA